ncbi:DegT/DnrJ/EryC1/StrS family aminotransferase [Thiocapsa bogorovii]|uniref:DegT/DnrJ/EryC1/StrS family aminotransferase n=1 Tax=Thiocapsa bogorovii TaxID=521689 RepID=UPI001E57A86B|nr:DegT/DnrJ/EryC1/StrS family aminotransferase [Thiocapsa bogorovii]UHD15473.1 DegT/DnrJ/EryC1/StrS family aminotransferase [Thiocapsa bogorovii]
MNNLIAFKQCTAAQLADDASVTLFWKGRVALYAILKSLGVGEGDEVIVPGLTCVVVPNAVIYAGAKPVYVDVDPGTYTLTPESILALITPRTRAIIAQNSFGLSADLDPILDQARNRGIEVIDDCTHGFGGTYKSRRNGSVARVSFFSTQWNKPFNTGIGGFAVTSDKALARSLEEFEARALKPSFKDVAMLRALYFARHNLMRESTYWPLLRLYRWLSAKNLVIGSSQGEELEAPQMPEDFLKGLSNFQADLGIKALENLAEVIRFRQRVAAEYDVLLSGLGKAVPVRPQYAEHSFLKYAVRVKNRGRMMRDAERQRVRLGDWFNSPLHPIESDLSPWGYEKGSCPRAEEAARELVNLPTDPDMSAGELERVKEFVRAHADSFL